MPAIAPRCRTGRANIARMRSTASRNTESLARQAARPCSRTRAENSYSKGGCPLGSLAGQLAETDPRARALIAAGFEQWSAAISDGLQELQAAGRLAPGIDADDLAITLLAALQGGLLLAQVQRDTRPLRTAVDTLLALTTPKPGQSRAGRRDIETSA